MRVLTYVDLDTSRVERQWQKVKEALERDDFRSADVKKLTGNGGYHRAKLDDTNRLLLRFARHAGEPVCLALEVIHQHAYDKSRFLRGAVVDDAKIVEPADVTASAAPLRYLNPARTQFHLLDKVVSFDEAQQAVLAAPAPLVLIGSAGSGKTALTLEKMRAQPGRVAFVTLSAHLARGAQRTYAAFGFHRDAQQVSFLSLREFLETQGAPDTPEVTFQAFQAWVARHRQTLGHLDAHLLFEEFRGVLGAAPAGPLTLEAYLALGVRQSLFPAEARTAVFEAFTRYQAWLTEEGRADPNLLAHAQLSVTRPSLDFLVVDEVQDFTPVQLSVLLAALKDRSQFLLSGDANQIVHPNFFSWAGLRSLLWADESVEGAGDVTALRVNFRNAREVTRVANAILKIKHARFGSVDRESTVLVDSAADEDGQVEILEATPEVTRALDQATRGSVDYAVLVLREEDKAAARAAFGTPLIFSVAEAKGLEYKNVILFNVISGERQTFLEVCENVTPDDLAVTELPFRRARDKGDKSLEALKFYVNGLFVGVTRAVRRVLLVESDPRHPLLALLAVRDAGQAVQVEAKASSKEAWAAEAQRLSEQGKAEQAQAIRERVLKLKPVPWPIQDHTWFDALKNRAGNGTLTKARDQQKLLEAALWYAQTWPVEELASDSYKNQAARRALADLDRARRTAVREINKAYAARNLKQVMWDVDAYGVDHRSVWNATPLMHAAMAHNVPLVEALLARGADLTATDHYGQMTYMYALADLPSPDDAPTEAAFADAWGRMWRTLRLVVPEQLDVRVDGFRMPLTLDDEPLPLLLYMLAALKAFMFDQVNADEPRSGLTTRASLVFVPLLTGHRWALARTLHGFGWNGDIPEPGTPLTNDAYGQAFKLVTDLLRRHAVGSGEPGSLGLWVEVSPGEYLPNPHMQLARSQPDGRSVWVSVKEAMALHAIGVSEGYKELLDEASVLRWPALSDSPLSPGEVSWRQWVIGTPLASGIFDLLVDPDLGPWRDHDLTDLFPDVPAGMVGLTLGALRRKRLVIADDQGRVAGLFGARDTFTAGRPLSQLPSSALRALLNWQRSGDSQDLAEHAAAFIALGYGTVVGPAKVLDLLEDVITRHPGAAPRTRTEIQKLLPRSGSATDVFGRVNRPLALQGMVEAPHFGPVKVTEWPPLSSRPLRAPESGRRPTAVPDFGKYVKLSLEARATLGVLLSFGRNEITWGALLKRAPVSEGPLTMELVQEFIDARLVLLDERNSLSFLHGEYGTVYAAGNVTQLPEPLLRLVLDWQRSGDVQPLAGHEAAFRAAGFAWVLQGPGGMEWPATHLMSRT